MRTQIVAPRANTIYTSRSLFWLLLARWDTAPSGNGAAAEHLGMFRLENLNAFKVSLEHTRAQANGELVQTLHDYEEEQSVRFNRMGREWQNQLKDPDDVFYASQERKRQIKELQRGLKRQTFKPRSKKKHR